MRIVTARSGPQRLSSGPPNGRREAARCGRFSRLGAVNAALVSLYFAPVWATQSLRALRSPYSGFEDQAHAVAAAYFRALFDLGLDGLVTAANVLAGIKFVVAAAFVAYLIEFARALVVGRKPDPQTLDAALALAGAAIMLWAWPALRSGDAGLIRLLASELVMLIGATIVVAVERQIESGQGELPVSLSTSAASRNA